MKNQLNNKRIGKLAAMIFIVMASLIMALPAYAGLVWPVPSSKNITQGFHDNNAIDIGAPTGTRIVAAQSGYVTSIFKCTQTHHNYGDCHGFGTGLVILGDDGRAYQYAHMQANSIPSNVYYGARVSAGQQIGCIGMTGYAYGPHLHFGVSYNSKYWEAGPNPLSLTYGKPDLTGVYVGNQSATVLSSSNAKISATLYKRAGINASAVGIYLGTTQGNMTKRNTEGVGASANNYRGGASFDIWYNLTSELGIVLSNNTTYYYRVYAIVEGTEIKGDIKSFTIGTPAKAKSSGSVSAANITRYASGWTRTVSIGATRKGTGKITYRSNSSRITVSASGIVTIPGNYSGTAQITISAAADANYNAASKTITVTVKKNPQPMKLTRATINVKYSAVKKKAQTTTFRVYNFAGRATIRSTSRYIRLANTWAGIQIKVAKGTPRGTYRVTVTATGNNIYSSGTKTITIRVK